MKQADSNMCIWVGFRICVIGINFQTSYPSTHLSKLRYMGLWVVLSISFWAYIIYEIYFCYGYLKRAIVRQIKKI